VKIQAVAAHLFRRRQVDDVIIVRLIALAALALFGGDDRRLSLLRGRRGLGGVDAGEGLGPRVDAYALAVDLDVGDARSVRIKADADVVGLRLRGGDDQFAGHLLVAVAAEDRAGERESALAVGR